MPKRKQIKQLKTTNKHQQQISRKVLPTKDRVGCSWIWSYASVDNDRLLLPQPMKSKHHQLLPSYHPSINIMFFFFPPINITGWSMETGVISHVISFLSTITRWRQSRDERLIDCQSLGFCLMLPMFFMPPSSSGDGHVYTITVNTATVYPTSSLLTLQHTRFSSLLPSLPLQLRYDDDDTINIYCVPGILFRIRLWIKHLDKVYLGCLACHAVSCWNVCWKSRCLF